MPVGIKQGSRVEVAAQFFDANGAILVLPSGAASLDIAYTDAVLGSSAAASIPMLSAGYDLVAAWNSSAAALGLAVISLVLGPVTLSPPDPVLRIMQGTGA